MKRLIIPIVWLFISSNWLPAASSVDVQVLNWDGTPAGGLQFPDAQNATIAEPWLHSPQYLRVIYNSDEMMWGVRIVTDNETNIGQVYPKPLNPGPPDEDGVSRWEWERLGLSGYQYIDGVWQTGNDNVSFGGLINPATKDNPNLRASLAWQVFNEPDPEGPDEIFKNWEGVWNVGGNWNDGWAYVVDKSDKSNGELVVGGIYYPNSWSAKYEMVVVGDQSISYLATHPYIGDSRLGDGDIAVYIAACFGVMENGDYTSILPRGDYGTVLYLELVYE